MPPLTRKVTLEMFAETAAAQAKLDAIAAEARKLGELNPEIKPQIEKSAALRQLAVLRGELKAAGDKAGQDLGTSISGGTKKGLGGDQRGGSWIAAAIGLGAPLTGPLLAGGAAFAAFGGLAVGSILPIGKALTGTGGLAAGWVTLDNRQRAAAQGVLALKDHYGQLAKSMEPRVFQVFNTALQTADQLLGPLGKLAASSGGAIEHFLVQFENDSGLRQFIGYAGTVAPQAIRLLGTDVTTLVHTVLTLAQAAGGAGLFELRLLTSGLQALDKVVSALPGPLAGLVLSVGGLAIAANKIGALGGFLKLTGLAGVAGAAKAAAAGMGELSLAEKGAAASGAALDAVSPLGWAVLAAGALTGLVFWLNSMGTATGRTIKTLEDQNKAVGFNTEGYFRAATAVGHYAEGSRGAAENLVNLHTGMVTGTTDAGHLSGATDQLTAAQQRLVTSGNRQNEFLTILQRKYGITEDAARSLAFHAGVLAKDVNAGGQSFRDAVTQAEAYGNANRRAQRPTSQLTKDMADFANKTLTATDRTTALTSALKLFFDPAVTADQDTIELKNDQVALAKALDASGGKTGLLTQKQRDARSTFDTYISKVAQTAHDTFDATGKTSDFTKIIDRALPVLEKAAGHNKALRKEIQDLINAERNLKSENVRLTVMAHGKWDLSGQSLPGGWPGAVGPAAGWRVPGYGGGDRWPALLEGGETVVPKHLTPAIAPLMAAHHVPGFGSPGPPPWLGMARGGVVGSYADGIGGLNKWVRSENAATITAMADALVVAMHKAAVSGGGSGALGGDAAANKALAARIFPFGSGQWAPFVSLEMREAGFNRFARNPSSGAYGIPQALPPTKMPFAAQAAGGSHAGPQLGWMFSYIGGRYGTPAAAWGHELSAGWYKDGLHATIRRPTLIGVGERGPERVDVTPGGEDLGPLLRDVRSLLADLVDISRKAPGVQAAQLGRVLSGRPVAPRPSVFASR